MPRRDGRSARGCVRMGSGIAHANPLAGVCRFVDGGNCFEIPQAVIDRDQRGDVLPDAVGEVVEHGGNLVHLGERPFWVWQNGGEWEADT